MNIECICCPIFSPRKNSDAALLFETIFTKKCKFEGAKLGRLLKTNLITASDFGCFTEKKILYVTKRQKVSI